CGNEMVIEKIIDPYGYVIFDIWKTDYFQNIPDKEERDAKFFQKEEKERKKEFPSSHQLLLPQLQK
ncbi:unnamed protein product, partial [marine sediment metagenome]